MSRLPFLPAVEDVSSPQLGWPSLVLAPGQAAMFCAGVRVPVLFCSSLPRAGEERSGAAAGDPLAGEAPFPSRPYPLGAAVCSVAAACSRGLAVVLCAAGFRAGASLRGDFAGLAGLRPL